jgi:DNA-directed RNA polymerase specialized sigma24 family protein
VGTCTEAEAVAAEELSAFASRSGSRLLAYAFLLTGNRAVAEDLVQDAMMEAHRRWIQLSAPEAYVRRCITNGAISWRRRRWREVLVEDVSSCVVTPSGPPDDLTVLWLSILRLKPRYRAALVLRFYEGLSAKEAAGVLSVPEATVRTWTARALAQLRPYWRQGEASEDLTR